MNLPEVQLKFILDGVLLGIRRDTTAHTSTETQSFLYRLLYGNVLQKWNFYTQGREIFNRASDHPRLIETRVFFDRSRGGLPTIHITLPNLQAGNDGIGMDEGYVDDFTAISQQGDLYITPVYTRAFQTTYHMIITSDNAFEVLTMYHVVKAGLIANMESLEHYGLRNVKFSGQDLQINDQIVPPGVFSRGIGLSLMYEADIPVFRLTPNVEDITPITGTPISLETGVHQLTSSTDVNGTINPLGTINELKTASRTYIITPNTGYHILDVLVDAVSVGAVSSYTFNNIQEDHTISVTFEQDGN